MGLKATATVSAPKGKGLLKQVTEVFPNIVTGVAKLAGHAAYTPIGIGRAIGDMSSGKLPSQQTGGSFLSRLKLNLHKYTPFAEDVIGIGVSVPKTVGNVGQFTASLAPGGMKPSDTEYGIANREGRIVNTVIGDVANLSLLAGAGAKAAAKMGAPGAASRLATVAKLGDQAGMAPAKIWTEPLRLAGKIPVKGGGTLAEAAKAASEGVLGKYAGTSLWGTEAGRALKKDIIEGRQQIAEHGSLPVADIARPAIKAGVSVPESQAAGLVLQGEAPVLAKIAETGKLADFVKARYPELDPQAAELAVKYHAGQLDEATTGRIDVARETYQALSDRQTGLAKEGVGSPVKLSEEQLGNQPLSSVVDDARFKLEKKRDAAQQIADLRSGQAARERARADARRGFQGDPFTAGKAEQRASALETKARRAVRSKDYYNQKIAELPAKMDSVIEAAPARFRPAMRTAGEGVRFLHDEAASLDKATPGAGDALRKLAEDMPTSLSQLTAAGVDPTHIIGGLAPGSAGGGSLAVKTRKLTQQFVRQGGESDLSLPGVVKKYEADSVRRYQNLVAENIAKVHTVTPADLGVGSLAGPELAQAMEALGYKPFATNRLGASVPAEQVTQSTRFMAAPLHDAFSNWFKTTPDNAFVEGATWLNRKWKNTVLPLSPRWHIGNIVGNAFLGTLGAGVDPVSLLKAVREAKAGRSWREWMAQDGEVAGTPHRLYSTGISHGDYEALFKGDVKEPRTALGRVINKSYRFNEFVDNVGRSAVYLNKLEQAKGLTGQLSKAGTTAEEYALRESLKAMGDFSRMTPFEQSYVKNVIPFYAWMRHMTALSVKLPLEHPLRVAWTMNLADRFGDQGDLPDYLKGNLKVGGTFLPTRALSPFSDVGAGALLNPASVAKGVSPILKLPVAAVTGINLSRGFDQTSRPKGTGNLDSLGRETFTPLLNRPGELANVALNQVPVARNLRNLLQGSAPRYDTGQRIKGLERESGAGRVYKPLLDLLNVPRPMDTSQDQIERTLAAAAKRRAANAKLKK